MQNFSTEFLQFFLQKFGHFDRISRKRRTKRSPKCNFRCCTSNSFENSFNCLPNRPTINVYFCVVVTLISTTKKLHIHRRIHKPRLRLNDIALIWLSICFAQKFALSVRMDDTLKNTLTLSYFKSRWNWMDQSIIIYQQCHECTDAGLAQLIRDLFICEYIFKPNDEPILESHFRGENFESAHRRTKFI